MSDPITVRFACAHTATVGSAVVEAPVCPTCGERRVARVTAPPPRFTGCARGPLVTTTDMPAATVSLASQPLVLKPVPET